FVQAEDGIRDRNVTGVQTCALPIWSRTTATISSTDNLKAVAKAKNKAVEDIVAVVLDRPRHDELVREIRQAGARIKLIPDGDVRSEERRVGKECRCQR